MIDPVATKSNPLTRQQMAAFLPNPRAIQSYESLQQDAGALTASVNSVITGLNAVTASPVLTTAATDAFSDESVLTTSEEISVDLSPEIASLSLIATGVTTGQYGDASHLAQFTVDGKGRLTQAKEFLLNSDNVTEGTTNLFFTQTRSRASISAGNGLSYVAGTGVMSAAPAGTYGSYTGITSRASFAGYVSPTISNPPTQGEVQAIADALQTIARTFGALVNDLKANGNLS